MHSSLQEFVILNFVKFTEFTSLLIHNVILFDIEEKIFSLPKIPLPKLIDNKLLLPENILLLELTCDKSKFLIFKFFNELQSLNILSINLTFSVLKFDISNDSNPEHPINIFLISITFFVSKLDIFKVVKELQR